MKNSHWTITLLAILCSVAILGAKPVSTSLVLKNDQTKDQDDMCFWVHPSDPAQSTIITSDKSAKMLFVYDLQGNTLQAVSDGFMPGNIDIRHQFPLGGQNVSIVGFNDRDNDRIVLYKVNPSSRLLERVDDGAIKTIENYGFCLYWSPKTGTHHGFVTSEGGELEQIELFENQGRISGKSVRRLKLGSQTEGCVSDDETGQVYFGEEAKGIWKIGAEPGEGTTPKLIAAVNDRSGLVDDVEGLTIYYAADGEGYLIASSQGKDKYTVFERKAPHNPVGEFTIAGAGSTDGIDVLSIPLNKDFAHGIFAVHNGSRKPYPVVVVKWEEIAASVGGGLKIDTGYWNPARQRK